MDRLGKQLTLFSFGIIGELNTKPVFARSAVRALCAPGPFFFQVLFDMAYLDGGVQAQMPGRERSGGLIAYSIPQQQLKQIIFV